MIADVMRPAFNLKPKHSVTMLSRKEWIRVPGTPTAVKGLVWFTDESRTPGEMGAGLYGPSLGRRFSICLGKHTTVFQAEIYAILACAYEIQADVRSEKYVSICSDSQTSLKNLQAVVTTSLMVQQCQKVLNDISIRTQWSFLVPWTL